MEVLLFESLFFYDTLQTIPITLYSFFSRATKKTASKKISDRRCWPRRSLRARMNRGLPTLALEKALKIVPVLNFQFLDLPNLQSRVNTLIVLVMASLFSWLVSSSIWLLNYSSSLLTSHRKITGRRSCRGISCSPYAPTPNSAASSKTQNSMRRADCLKLFRAKKTIKKRKISKMTSLTTRALLERFKMKMGM